MEHCESSYTDALRRIVELTSDFPDTVMSGGYCRHGKAELENGQMCSVCCAEHSEDGSDGYGTWRTTSGPRCTRIRNGDGFTSMLARRHGTTRDYTLRDGERRCRTASPSPSMVRQMSPADMFARQSMHWSEAGVPKKSCSTSRTRSADYDGRIWPRMSDSVSRRRIPEKTESFEASSSPRLPIQSCATLVHRDRT